MTMTPKEIAALDKKIEALKPKIFNARDKYEALVDQMAELLDQRYPERKEEAIKERLYEAAEETRIRSMCSIHA